MNKHIPNCPKIHELRYNLDTLDSVAQELSFLLPHVSVITLSGPFGAGKTTLIQALLHAQGIEEPVQSPTFNYLQTYTNIRGQTFYHFDLYRLNNLQDFLSAGFDEYLYQPNSWALIEWPEIIMPLLKKQVLCSTLSYTGQDQRLLQYVILK